LCAASHSKRRPACRHDDEVRARGHARPGSSMTRLSTSGVGCLLPRCRQESPCSAQTPRFPAATIVQLLKVFETLGTPSLRWPEQVGRTGRSCSPENKPPPCTTCAPLNSYILRTRQSACALTIRNMVLLNAQLFPLAPVAQVSSLHVRFPQVK
jgi:hypothetical protein